MRTERVHARWRVALVSLAAGGLTTGVVGSFIPAQAATRPLGSALASVNSPTGTVGQLPLANTPPLAVSSVSVDSTSSAFPDDTAANITDGGLDTEWSSDEVPASVATPHWAQLTLAGGAQPIYQVSVEVPYALGDNLADNHQVAEDPDAANKLYGYLVTDLDVLVSNSGAPVATRQLASNTSHEITVTFTPPVTGNAIHIDITGATLNGVPGQPAALAEVAAYGPPASGPTAATSADGFVDTAGVNVYPNAPGNNRPLYWNGSFPNGEPSLSQDVVRSGMRHVRVEILAADPVLLQEIAALGNQGVRTDALFEGQEYSNAGGVEPTSAGCPTTARSCPTATSILQQIEADQAADAQAKGIPQGPFAVDMVEGPNEPDTQANLVYKSYTYPQSVAAYDQDLYDVIHTSSDPAIAAIKVAPSAFGNPADTASIGDLAPKCDYATLHSYPFDGLPDRFLEGNGNPQDAGGYLHQVSSYCPGKPVVVTETGYSYSTAGYSYSSPYASTTYDSAGSAGFVTIPEAAGGKYIPRMLFENYNRNVARTLLFQIYDDASGNYGLIRSDGTPRPAYSSVQNLISVLADPGPSFTAGSLDYTISGGDPFTLRHALLQKRNGDFYLALWTDTPSTDDAGGPTSVKQDISSAQPVTLTFNQPVAHARVYLPDGGTDPVGSFANPTTLSLQVPDQIMLVRVTPGTSPGASLAPSCTPSADSSDAITGASKPSNAFDGDTSTYWESAETPGDHWVQCAFNFTRTVNQVLVQGVRPAQTGGQQEIQTDFDISTQLGDGPFVVQKSITGNTAMDVKVDFPPVAADVVRVTVHASTLDGAPEPVPSIAEVVISPPAMVLAAPTVSPEPSAAGAAAIAAAAFTGGVAPWSCTVDYGDGTGPLAGTVSPGGGGDTCTGPSHTYSAAGNYVVAAVLTDAGGSCVTSGADHTVSAAAAP